MLPDDDADPQSTGRREGEPRYPACEVQLSGEDGNAFAVLGRVRKALRAHIAETTDAATAELEVKAFFEEATSGDYDHLLATCMRWVSVV